MGSGTHNLQAYSKVEFFCLQILGFIIYSVHYFDIQNHFYSGFFNNISQSQLDVTIVELFLKKVSDSCDVKKHFS